MMMLLMMLLMMMMMLLLLLLMLLLLLEDCLTGSSHLGQFSTQFLDFFFQRLSVLLRHVLCKVQLGSYGGEGCFKQGKLSRK